MESMGAGGNAFDRLSYLRRLVEPGSGRISMAMHRQAAPLCTAALIGHPRPVFGDTRGNDSVPKPLRWA